jgi:hypothetical protein
MQIPGVVKVVVNMGVGDAAKDSKLIDGALRDLTAITGQKPQVRKATKSIAQFKLREGMPIGAKVTLRGDRMWEFLDRLVTIALPRIRDFRGLSPKQFDGNGNYTFGPDRAVDVPRDRPGHDRPAAGHGHHRGAPRPTRRRGPRAARASSDFPQARTDKANDRLVNKPTASPVRCPGYTRCQKCGRRTRCTRSSPLPHRPAREWHTAASCGLTRAVLVTRC